MQIETRAYSIHVAHRQIKIKLPEDGDAVACAACTGRYYVIEFAEISRDSSAAFSVTVLCVEVVNGNG